MSVIIKLHKMLQPYADDRETVEMEGDTVGECLSRMVARYPEMEKELFRSRGKPYSFFDIHLNGESADPAGMEQHVSDGDEISIEVFKPGA